MTTLVTLSTSTQLLQICNHRVTYILICDQQIPPKQAFQCVLSQNPSTCTQTDSSLEENIIRVWVQNVGLLVGQPELTKAKLLREFIGDIEGSQLGDCFWFRDGELGKIKGLRLLGGPRDRDRDREREVRDRDREREVRDRDREREVRGSLEVFSVFGYLLCFSSSVKDYLTRWAQIAFKKQKFKPEIVGNSPIQQFFKDIFTHSITSTKMAIHSLEILLQKLQPTPQKPSKYQSLKLSLPQKQTPSPRLKQSTSMTSLSSTKNRKYKKQSVFKNPAKPHKENTNMGTMGNMGATAGSGKSWDKVGFGETCLSRTGGGFRNTSSMLQKVQREDAILQSFSKINKLDVENVALEQENLVELLNKKEECRKKLKTYDQTKKNNSAFMDISQIPQCEDMPVQSLPIQKQKTLNPQKVMNIHISPTKPQNRLRLSSCLYSINQSIQPQKQSPTPTSTPTPTPSPSPSGSSPYPQQLHQQPTGSQEQTLRKREKKQAQFPQQIKTLSDSLKQINNQNNDNNPVPSPTSSKPATIFSTKSMKTPFNINCGFLLQTIQMLCTEKILRKFWIISLYSMYAYYFVWHLSEKSTQKEQMSHRNNLLAICSRITQLKSSPDFTKHLDNRSLSELEFLLTQSKNFESADKARVQQAAITVLLRELDSNKTEIVKQKNQLMKNGKFRTFLLYLIRLALAISVVKDIKGDNCGVEDFNRYECQIQEKRDDLEIDLLAEIRNLEMLV